MGAIITVPEIGSALNSVLSPIIFREFNDISYPILASVALCFLSFLCAIFLVIIDKKENKEIANEHE